MAGIFLKILNMSISASWIVLVVLILRFVLKRAPKWINCMLWGIVGLRLIMPFSLESAFSLIPSTETISQPAGSPRPYFESGISMVDSQVNNHLKDSYFEGITRPTGNFLNITTILAIVWIIGIAALLIYTLISYLRLRNKMGTAVLLRDNIYQSESVVSPFVLGIIKPKIYVPFNLSENDMQNVIAHEMSHIKRKDHLWKPLGFLILTVYWFNPFMWISYIMLCRDIEAACDEKVVKDFSNEQKADYSEALLACSTNRRIIAACPIAFGEADVKSRVKSVLNYKKPAFWIIIASVITGIAVAVCFLTNPKTAKEYYDSGYSLQITVNTLDSKTQIPTKTETLSFDTFNGAKGKLSNGTGFEITTCDLQTGSLTVRLSGTSLYSRDVKPVVLEEITVEQNSDGITLTDKDEKQFFTFKFVETQTLDNAISQAILKENKPKYYSDGTECITEGHIVYGIVTDKNEYTAYVLTNYNAFGFENGYFMSKAGGTIPAVMTFEKTPQGYNLLNIEYAQDGSYYAKSIKKMFPEKYQHRVIFPTPEDTKSLWEQCTSYAQAYLDKIGRNEEICDYSQVEHTLLTDVGISVEVSNKILEYKLPYNDSLGYYESIEDNIRYIYTTSYDKERNKVVLTKEIYDTKEVVEKIEIDSLTGGIISSTPKSKS